MIDPPYRIVSERLVIRCWEPRDASHLKEAIDSSLDELRPWMPWARAEPQELSEKVALLRRFRGAFDLGTGLHHGDLRQRRAGRPRWHGVAQASERATRSRSATGSGRATSVGGLATESSAALTRVAFELCEVDRVEIRVDPANEDEPADPSQARLRRGGDVAAPASTRRGWCAARRDRLQPLPRRVRGLARLVDTGAGVRRRLASACCEGRLARLPGARGALRARLRPAGGCLGVGPPRDGGGRPLRRSPSACGCSTSRRSRPTTETPTASSTVGRSAPACTSRRRSASSRPRS